MVGGYWGGGLVGEEGVSGGGGLMGGGIVEEGRLPNGSCNILSHARERMLSGNRSG